MVDISGSARDITRVSFIGKDFDTYVTEIESFLNQRFGTSIFNNFRVSGFGRTLIEMMSWGLSTLSWSLDRAATDMYLQTVEVPATAAILARFLGVKPNAAVPSSADVEITLGAPQSLDLIIDEGTTLDGPSGLVFQLSDRVEFLAGEVGPKIATVIQSELKEELFISSGEPSQYFGLTRETDTKYIASSTARSWIDNVEWEEKEFIEYEQTDHFQVDYVEFPPKIRFGDGIAGNIPVGGAEIRLQYKVTEGVDGNAPANSITNFSQPITLNFSTVDVTVTNPLPSSGGANSSTVNEIRALAPKVFASAQRAVTQVDYDALINAYSHPIFGSVAIGSAIIVRSYEDDAEMRSIVLSLEGEGVSASLISRIEAYWNLIMPDHCGPNVVSCRILASDVDGRYIAPSSGLVQELLTYLNGFKESTVAVKVVDGSPDVVSVDVSARVKIDSDMVESIVLGNVSTALSSLILGKSYGESLRIGDLYSAIEAIDGVIYSQLTLSPASKRNGFGDIEIESYEVITLGTINTTKIVE